eukprot:GHVT01023599.1.p1 GENE.GHVT01023599.1~~GHVT01023599.1.p1  ORF type:complete len:327 (+),score=97.40 GHVT01023599.1:1035-2015(+)
MRNFRAAVVVASALVGLGCMPSANCAGFGLDVSKISATSMSPVVAQGLGGAAREAAIWQVEKEDMGRKMKSFLDSIRSGNMPEWNDDTKDVIGNAAVAGVAGVASLASGPVIKTAMGGGAVANMIGQIASGLGSSVVMGGGSVVGKAVLHKYNEQYENNEKKKMEEAAAATKKQLEPLTAQQQAEWLAQYPEIVRASGIEIDFSKVDIMAMPDAILKPYISLLSAEEFREHTENLTRPQFAALREKVVAMAKEQADLQAARNNQQEAGTGTAQDDQLTDDTGDQARGETNEADEDEQQSANPSRLRGSHTGQDTHKDEENFDDVMD